MHHITATWMFRCMQFHGKLDEHLDFDAEMELHAFLTYIIIPKMLGYLNLN